MVQHDQKEFQTEYNENLTFMKSKQLADKDSTVKKKKRFLNTLVFLLNNYIGVHISFPRKM